ncbi:MAG TPA: hypothetical protein VEX38_00325 [Fimbriimonadaceae bacterium]|nr:hypothetical protein [Fimbriimonadaceae bacterium]
MRLLLTVGLLATVTLSVAGKEPPKWLDKKVAGYLVAFDDLRQPVGIFDKKQGLYLLRMVECDGGHLGVLLTRDRHLVSNWGHKVPNFKTQNEGVVPLTEKPLPSLATGKGIKLGATPGDVTSKLGRPGKIQKSGPRKQFTDYLYTWRNVVKGEGEEWLNRYTFKEGRLIEIEFRRDSVPGCGGSYSHSSPCA